MPVLPGAVLALLAIGFPMVVFVKIRAQRQALGKNPVILGATAGWQGWFERLAPFALLFWPVTWLWAAVSPQSLATDLRLSLGLTFMVAGGVLSASSVVLMGRAWRIGIDPENRTELAESGPYRFIRHPIYTGWLITLLGTVLAMPRPAIDAAAAVTALGAIIQALREERHLLSTFGERYAGYAARTGRFVPRLGSR
jgi:protein-S-isoprenylcysteine O-methyltransferase Ste14